MTACQIVLNAYSMAIFLRLECCLFSPLVLLGPSDVCNAPSSGAFLNTTACYYQRTLGGKTQLVIRVTLRHSNVFNLLTQTINSKQ